MKPFVVTSFAYSSLDTKAPCGHFGIQEYRGAPSGASFLFEALIFSPLSTYFPEIYKNLGFFCQHLCVFAHKCAM